MDENFGDNNAKENFEVEDNNANENLLSQSYIDSIQKVTGNDRASLVDFQIPPQLLEKRKRNWNALFEKYSSIVYDEDEDDAESIVQEEEDEVISKNDEQPESPEQEKEDELSTKNMQQPEFPEQGNQAKCETKDIQRFPMRKPMSMVQYWVNTGNQPYAKNNLEKSQSESGSSLAEESLETAESTNSSCEMTNNSLEKNLETNEISRNMRLRLASSSGSSVDTVAYVLANNNTTKKADTIAIMEGSKIVNKEPSQPVVAINNIEKVKHSKKEVSFLDNILHNLTSKNINTFKTISKNMENVDNINRSHQNKSKNQEDIDNRCINDSDESIFKSKYDFYILSQNSTCKNDIEKFLPASIIENKTFKRKKLHHNTESPAEFTPGSEDNASQLTLRLSMWKCDHPALETPRISSRPSHLVRYQKLKLRKKRKGRISQSFRMFQSQKNSENNNLQNSQGNSQTVNDWYNDVVKNSNQNLEKAGDCSYAIKMQENCKEKSNLHINKNLFNDSNKKALNLKPLVIPLQRLPYKYYSIDTSSLPEKHLDSLNLSKIDKKIDCTKNSLQSLPSKESHALETKSNNFKNFIGASQNLTSNDESDNVDCKSSATKSQDFSSQIQKNNSKKSIKYIIDFSSDDEPELSVSNLRKSMQKVSKETTRLKNPLVNNCSEKESRSSILKDVNNKIRISDSDKIKSDRKKHDLKRKTDKEIKLVQSEKSRKIDISCKNSLLENNTKPSSKLSSFSKQVDKKFSLLSSDEETIIIEPRDSSVPNKLLEKRIGNHSPDNKTLKEKFDQTSSNGLTLSEKLKSLSNKKNLKASSSTTLVSEKHKSSSNEKKIKVLESKSSLKKMTSVKSLRYKKDASFSSDDDLQIPIKPIFNGKFKLLSSAVKDNSVKSLSATGETVKNSIGDLYTDSESLKENEEKINYLEERINRLKVKNNSSTLNSDNNHLKTLTQRCMRVDSSEEENICIL